MSKGIGREYLQSNMAAWHKKHPAERQFLAMGDGVKAPMPRYYREKIYDTKTQRQIVKQRGIERSARSKSTFIPDIIRHQQDLNAARSAAITKMLKPRKNGKL